MSGPWEQYQDNQTGPWENYKEEQQSGPWEEYSPEASSSAPVKREPYTVNDLQGDDLVVARDYMRLMVGKSADDWDEEELLNKFTNRQRSFAAGNSVTTAREIARLKNLSDEELTRVGEAYTLFNNAEGIFSDENTWGETLEGLGDYARSVLLDPLNVFSLGVGKAASAGVTKPIVRVAQKRAMDVYKKKLASKATKEEAVKAADKFFERAVRSASKKEAGEIVAKRSLSDAAKRKTTTEVGAAVGVDTLAGTGVEIAYQEAMVLTGVQDEINRSSVAIVGLGALALGTVSVGLARANSGLGPVDATKFKADPKTTAVALNQLGEQLAQGNWKDKVRAGKEVGDLDDTFWYSLLMGDKETEMKGLFQILGENGVAWQRRSPNDTVSNWITDLLNKADKDLAEGFVKTFEDISGKPLSEIKNTLGKDGIEGFSNLLAYKLSQGAKITGALGNIARYRGIKKDTLLKEVAKGKQITLTDYAEAVLSPALMKKDERFTGIGGKNWQRFQNNTIRMIVSNLSTTSLNVMGWGSATALNSMSDIFLATMYGGKAGAKLLTADVKGAKEAMRVATQLAANQKEKFMYLADTASSADFLRTYSLLRPESMREITQVLPGGVEDISKLLKDNGFDPTQWKLTEVSDKVVDGVQLINLVKSQDIITKSVEFSAQLDKQLRLNMDIGLRELMAAPDAKKVMGTKEFAELEARAIFETQKAVFSQSYKGPTMIGEVAGVIEDARNIPGIGLLVPFGRFFNNTIAFMSDGIGLTSVMKLTKQIDTSRTHGELAARAAVTWAGVSLLVDSEAQNRQEGLAWYEAKDADGSISDMRFDFPLSMWKAAAHLMSYHTRGEEIPASAIEEVRPVVDAYLGLRLDGEVPPELIGQIGQNVVGQLTRELTDASDGVLAMVQNMIAGEFTLEDFQALVTTPASQIVSGWTRTLEPINTVVGLAKSEGFENIDRKQGVQVINDSFRYMDNIIPFMKEGNEEKFNAATGASTNLDAAKFLGNRSSTPTSNVARAMNTLGLPHWKLNEFSLDPKADNRFNQLFNSMLEDEAGKLLQTNAFKNGTLEVRKAKWSALLEQTRKTVKSYMERGIESNEDRGLKIILDISAKGQDRVEKALEANGFDDLSELSYEQLKLVEGWLNTRDTYIGSIN